MKSALPPSDLGHRWLERFKAHYLAAPKADLVFEHLGPITSDDVPFLVGLAHDHSRNQGDQVIVTKRLVSVLVEVLDNLCRHGSSVLCESTFAIMVRDRHGYRLAAGNVVPAATGAVLEERVTILNMMGREDLKGHYLKLLTGKARSSNGGAGLGFLTLARKSASPLVMSCDRMGPFTSYFTLEVQVGTSGDPFSPAA